MAQSSKTIEGTCHCGSLGYQFNDDVEFATECNCSICRRLGALWIYSAARNIKLKLAQDSQVIYSHGKKSLVFTSCLHCGCSLSWTALKGGADDTMAVNLRLASLDDIAAIPVRKFDGADTWTFIDE